MEVGETTSKEWLEGVLLKYQTPSEVGAIWDNTVALSLFRVLLSSLNVDLDESSNSLSVSLGVFD